MFTFSITQWHAWAPSIESLEDWQAWAVHPYTPVGDGRLPDLGFLPPLQRRRLSPLARMSLGCAWPLASNAAPMPIVYASHHGETPRGHELLRALAAGETLSPTSFSLSVHNAIVGQWSILRQEHAESVALSVEGDSLEAALIEACLLLTAGHDDVLVVLAETRQPSDYEPWIDDVPFPYAMALHLTRGSDFQLTQEAADPRQHAGHEDWPSPLSLLRHLLLSTPEWRHTHSARRWHWRRLTSTLRHEAAANLHA